MENSEPKLSKSELAALDLMIAYMQDNNQTQLGGFISSVVNAVTSAASFVADVAVDAATAVADAAVVSANAVADAAVVSANAVAGAATGVASAATAVADAAVAVANTDFVQDVAKDAVKAAVVAVVASLATEQDKGDLNEIENAAKLMREEVEPQLTLENLIKIGLTQNLEFSFLVSQ